MMEIGSEFTMGAFKIGKNGYCALTDSPKRYVLSGRTGLYLIAQELKTVEINSVSLPAYCCGSIVAPFIDAQFKVLFYSGADIPGSEAILIMDYFGFIKEETLELVHKCKKAGLKVIVDATQTAFSRSNTYDYADFIVVSYRKWLDCLCAAVYSKSGFNTPEYTKENKAYVETWRLAAQKKKQYLNTGLGNKQEFLDLYSKANEMLANDYIGYKASVSEINIMENVDSSYIRNSRRDNAKILIQGLAGRVNLMFNKMADEDCPLHVPILLSSEQRTEIRKLLIEEKIYCPCHWPVDEKYPYQRTALHDEEMSLICDQRYTTDDIAIEVEAILKAIGRRE